MTGLRLAEVVATSGAVATTRSRTAKIEAIAALLRRAVDDEIEVVASWLSGEPRQGRIGVGWAGLRDLGRAPTTAGAGLTVAETDAAFATIAACRGPGSARARGAAVAGLFARATADEQSFLRELLSGALRQGALAGIVTDAVALAAGRPRSEVRRAVMLVGSLPEAARLALVGGADALTGLGVIVGRPLAPMLATPAESASAAWHELGPQVLVDAKYDGARIQVHRRDSEVAVFTRSLRDITASVPEVVRYASELSCKTAIFDGEALAVDDDGRPSPFQDTMSGMGAGGAVRPYFFDCLHLDGTDLIDEPLTVRLAALESAAPGLRIPSTSVASPDEVEALLSAALTAGHEGVMVKSPDGRYAAGSRGRSWQKIKPVHTFDLVVLAAEWGSGRRRGWLSNIHLGARDPAGGPPIMVGKTFKGMTDDMLAWQTAEFPRYEAARDDHTVYLHPELVVEVAIDGVQRSTRYPGGIALRFARVVRYRPDKSPAEADSLTALARLGP